jgi:hypothetical protein
MDCTEIVKSEDCVECYFFPLDDYASDVDKLNALCLDIETFVKNISEGYIWHRSDLKFHKRFSNKGVSLIESESGNIRCIKLSISD